MENDINNIILKFKNIITNFFEYYYADLIQKRMTSLYDIIFFDIKDVNETIKSDEVFLKYYGINQDVESILQKKIPFNKYIIEHGFQGTMMYLSDNKLKQVLYLPRKKEDNYKYDCIFIHELLHVVFEHLIINEENLVISRGGFETMSLKGENNLSRDYEYINEILHQRLTEDILEFMNKNNISLFNTLDENQKSLEIYSLDKCEVIEQFYQKYKNNIIKFFFDGDECEFFNNVNQDLFQKFNSWVKEFYYKYPDLNERIKCIKENNDEYKNLIEEGLKLI